jgi:carboxyl-terminal processing protease
MPRKRIRRAAACAALSGALLASCAGFPAQGGDGDLDGNWISEPSGYILEVSGSRVALFDISSAGAVSFLRGRLRGEELSLGSVLGFRTEGRLTRSGPGLRMTMYDTSIASFSREEAGRVSLPLLRDSADPRANFEVFAATFGERYAFFGLRGIDWEARVADYRNRITPATGDAELFALLSELVDPLDDAHVGLHDPRGRESSSAEPAAWEAEAQLLVDAIKANYLEGPPRKTARGMLVYGKLRAGPAYIFLKGMEGFSEGSFAEAKAALDAGLDEALSFAAGAPGLVLDLRLNGGGHDAHSLQIAARFARERRLAFSRRTRSAAGWTEDERFYVEPAEGRPRWDGPLALLVSGATASAAENLVLALADLPETTVVGESSRGAFSDMLMKRLPNGWLYTISNEEYRGADGRCYEKTGYPPEVLAPVDIEAARSGRDPGLEAACRALGSADGR